VVLCVVTSVTLVGLSGGRALAGDSRCEALQAIVPATFGAITGDVEGAARHARTLRDLSTRELVPARVKPALRKLARFFERAPDLGILERGQALGDIVRPLSKLILYTAQTCGPVATTTTTRPLR
jgi:hypothetical protein